MSFLFSECKALKYLPDLSKWNLSKANYISGMFYGCSNLISLPDISKWKINNVKIYQDYFMDAHH